MNKEIRFNLGMSEKITFAEVLWHSWKGGRSLYWFDGLVIGTESEDIWKAVGIALKEGYIKRNVKYEHPFGNPYFLTQLGRYILDPILKEEKIDWDWDLIESWLN